MATKPLNPSYRESGARPKNQRFTRDRAKGMGDAEPLDDGQTDEERERQHRYDVLCSTVDQDIRLAITARENSGIEELWSEDDDQYNGFDELNQPGIVKTRDQIPRAAIKDARSKVFVPITKPKTDIGVARVSEMLLPNDDKPWDIAPTKVPDIEEAANAPDKGETVTLGDGTQANAVAVAKMILDKAKEFAEKEADWIEDKFQEGSVYSEMRQVLRDAGRIGTGVIKGPVPVERITGKWTTARKGLPTQEKETVSFGETLSPPDSVSGGGTPIAQGITAVYKRTSKIEPTSFCIRAQDAYPDPACGDNIHDGAFFVERQWVTGKTLKGWARLPNYDARCIVQCLQEGPQSYQKRFDSRQRIQVGDSFTDSKLYEVFNYYGDATPEDLELLMEHGNPDPEAEPDQDGDEPTSPLDAMLTEEERRYLATVPVVLSMVNGRCVKATLNPMETGGFPFDFFPWEPVKGQPWGRGIPRKMQIAQRILNSATRALLENAGLSAGPQIVTQKGAITPWDNVYEVRGRKGWDFNPNDMVDADVRKAFMVVDVPSSQQELSAIIQFALDMADQLTNLPMLMQGDQQANTSPETLGGLKMLFNNAMSPLRVIAKLFDDRLISPHLKRYHDWAMEKGPDNIKGGDSQIVAKGSTALIQREEGREFLMQVFPVKDDMSLRIDPAKLIAEMARSNGFDMSTVQYSDEDWKKKQEELAKNPPPPDPAIEAAQIRSKALVDAANINAQSSARDLDSKERSAALDRAHDEAMAAVDREIAQMQADKKDSQALLALKARLAESAMNNRQKSDEMALKLAPQNQSGTGI